ncbi:JAB domain-containing protein [Liquorilactobacillus satsumensis]|uniref:DNA repair protein n=1 Tax=Liquorilactobacillus satsumensis DSM 16230 = JCM 12392 TaxID=1423801 RepID=A0A0R1UYZ9_9LACO|nr:DNA repair protein [Liquorilactobacillus satsumensis DSM 16230 = JCM 12392]MCC7667521.1 DNA repair protein [Liquorilactobacillus satsumensis]MCP9357051.1 JAB domain-containing protein [Liquorilactobacillus satsumensis]MCP9370998.1 JAB domain-containing protein [Liquorilactobacillus satsumensis]
MLTNRIEPSSLLKQIENYTAGSLSDHELLFLCLNFFLKKEMAAKKVELFFKQYSDLRQLRYLTETELAVLWGNPQLIMVTKILCELAIRLRRCPKLTLGRIYTSQEIGKRMVAELGMLQQETLQVILLDIKNQILESRSVFKGTLDAATVHPREIFSLALRYHAAHIMVVHNHPSGDPTPSQNDLKLTNRLRKCGEIMGINLLDHLIVGSVHYLSMREEKIIN